MEEGGLGDLGVVFVVDLYCVIVEFFCVECGEYVGVGEVGLGVLVVVEVIGEMG